VTSKPIANTGSFRDPVNRIYQTAEGRILRGLDKTAAAHCAKLITQPFFQEWVSAGKIVKTIHAVDDADTAAVRADGWAEVVEHAPVPFVSYPYEWAFFMLQDAALLQLELLETAMQNSWTIKDATPYNIQWQGAKPIFIDVPSIVPAVAGEPWLAYRQFCMLFLYPLMLKAHLNIDFNGSLRADLDGISPSTAAKYFGGWRRFKSGVMAHVHLPASVENSILKRERDRAPAQKREVKPQSEAMIFGLVQGVRNTVRKLRPGQQHSAWSHYAQTHSYADADIQAKREFVARHAATQQRQIVWDLGANTGDFSRLCALHAQTVVAVDSDIEAVERMYVKEKETTNGNILPLVMNLANMSPNQGWAGKERAAFDARQKPQLVLCLALVHHLRIAANIPMPLFLDWLHNLGADAIVEFVGRDDEMTKKLLLNKKEQYDDYNLAAFEAELKKRFTIRESLVVKGGSRQLYYLEFRK
jgi:hypothetical protein